MANIQHISSNPPFPHSLQTSLNNPVPHPPEPEGSLRILLSINSRQPLPNNLKQNQKWNVFSIAPVSSFSVIFVNTAVFPGWSPLTLMNCIFWLTWPWPSPLECKFLKCQDLPSVHWWTLKSLEQCLSQGWSSANTDLINQSLLVHTFQGQLTQNLHNELFSALPPEIFEIFFKLVFSSSLDKFWEVELLDHMVDLFLIF